jgi:hypothetical protein
MDRDFLLEPFTLQPPLAGPADDIRGSRGLAWKQGVGIS